ncbi:astacin [Dictyocaulus viviparus]|uniref:Metalloendopeptidase n=1 Tax=Dictyocaulus viviparus TaxID=29172 RepID=A0A0D8X8G4_DICVI|nr:astacin [Dictyocaulus viviparus]
MLEFVTKHGTSDGIDPAYNRHYGYRPETDAEKTKQVFGKSYSKIDDGVDQLDLPYQQQTDMGMYQGNIMLTEEQKEEISNNTEANRSIRNKRQAYRNWKYPRTLWKGGVVKMRSVCSKKLSRHGKMRHALTSRKITQLRIKSTSFMNMDAGQELEQLGFLLTMASYKTTELLSHIGKAIHEIGHALGMFHTHTRHDRDDFFILIEENFRKGWKNQLDKEPKDRNYNYEIPYDYGSVMHYGSRMYVYVLNKAPGGCGGILNATNTYETFNVSMGDSRLRSAKDEPDKCTYWIQAPVESTIHLTLNSYDGDVSSDSCVYSGVEIKVMEDKRLTGYKCLLLRFCSKNSSGTVMVSKDNLVIVTIYNRLLTNKVTL